MAKFEIEIKNDELIVSIKPGGAITVRWMRFDKQKQEAIGNGWVEEQVTLYRHTEEDKLLAGG